MNLTKICIILLTLFVAVSCKKNKIPKADAGLSQTITLPTNFVSVTGSGTDEDGSISSYLWSQVSGPASSSITNSGSATTTITGLILGSYVFQLQVTDDDGATASDTMMVTVNQSPIQNVTINPANNPNEKMLVQIGTSDQSYTGGNEWVIDAWTVGSQTYTGRKIFKFDFGNIPASATIQSATLYLYSNSPPENGNLVNANFGSNNALYLRRITSAWSPSATNWSNQPSVSTADQISIPHTSQSELDLSIDVTQQVSAMIQNNSNYGWMLRLQNETAFNSRQFVSSHHATKVAKHPRLVIVYQP